MFFLQKFEKKLFLSDIVAFSSPPLIKIKIISLYSRNAHYSRNVAIVNNILESMSDSSNETDQMEESAQMNKSKKFIVFCISYYY